MNDKPHSDPVSDDDEPDAETLAAFNKILGKVGPEWLKEQMKSLTPPPRSSEGDDKPASLESFLQSALNKSETARERMADQMERMRDLLTPEQLIQLRSVPKPPDDADGQNLPQKKGPPAPKAAPKRKWL